jgi:hypothetical protein
MGQALALKAQLTRAQAANGTYWISGGNSASNAHINVYSFGADFVC